MFKNLFTITACFFIFVTTASAGVQVSPTKLELSQKKRISSVSIKNASNSERKFQSVLVKKNYAKKKPDEKAPYEPTKDLMATPVVFTVPANTKQIIRVIARQAIKATKEYDDYRLLIKELPLNALDVTGVSFLSAFSVPINIIDIKEEIAKNPK